MYRNVFIQEEAITVVKYIFEMKKVYLKLSINLLPTIRKIWKESKTGVSSLTSFLIALQILPISVDGHKVGDLPITINVVSTELCFQFKLT